jgi:hypothetical protein
LCSYYGIGYMFRRSPRKDSFRILMFGLVGLVLVIRRVWLM